MDLRQLTFLIAVADAGAIRKAARDLQIAQPPVSQAIRQLEAELGTELLRRSPLGIELTEEGEELVRRGRVILADVASARAAIVSRATHQATIHVGLTNGWLAAGRLTVPIIESFRANHPDLALRLHPTGFDQVRPLLEREVDVSLVRGPLDHREIECFPVAFEERRMMVYRGGPFGRAESLTMDDIADVPMVAIEGPDSWNAYWQLDEERGYRNVYSEMTPASSLEAIQYTIATCGAVLPGAASIQDLAPNPLIGFLPVEGVGANEIMVARRRDDRRRPIRAFMDEAVAVAQREFAAHDIPDMYLAA